MARLYNVNAPTVSRIVAAHRAGLVGSPTHHAGKTRHRTIVDFGGMDLLAAKLHRIMRFYYRISQHN
jgi:hypothetical protein